MVETMVVNTSTPRSLQIVVAYGVQVAMFHQAPLPTDLLGALMVLATVIS